MKRKILMLVDWTVARLDVDSDALQAPDKFVANRPYWFFRYWPDPRVEVELLDIGALPWVHALEGRVLRFYLIQSLIAFFRRKKYDLVISHSARSALAFAFFRSFLDERSPLHVVVDVGCFNGGRTNPAELALIKKAGQSLGGIITHSSVQSEYYDAHMPHVPYRFIPFGVDADYFKPLDVPQDDFILSFGSRARDYPTLIKAWNRVAPKGTRLRIIGIDDPASVEQAEGTIDIMGRVPLRTLMLNIAAARFVILPLPNYRYSCGQMSFLQSMAMGKSCIVTRTPSSEDYLEDMSDAVLVRPYDPEDLARKISLLLRDRALTDSIARQARLSIEARFPERRMAAAFHEFFSTIG